MCWLMIAAPATFSSAQQKPTGLRLARDTAEVRWWSVRDTALFHLLENEPGVKAHLYVDSTTAGRWKLVLTLTNVSADSVVATPVFPSLAGMMPDQNHPADLHYLFPAQGRFVSNADATLDEPYSGRFPLQFMSVYSPEGGGIYLLCKDTTNAPKRFRLEKHRGAVTMEVEHRAQRLAPGESWHLPPMEVVCHGGDWRPAFSAYRDWLRTWYSPAAPRKAWFRDVYNFRQIFLHPIFGDVGAFDKQSKAIGLLEQVGQSKEAFGNVDYVHLFDWSQTPAHGRVGDYNPWEYLGGKRKLRREIKRLRKLGIYTGLYYEGYLISKVSETGQAFGTAWQMRSPEGKPYARFGNNYFYPCPLVPAWQTYLTGAVSRAINDVCAQGAYIDQYGFGWQYGCHNPTHGHDVRVTNVASELQVPAEQTMMKKMRSTLPDEVVTYTEEMPTDVATQYQDGSFTYAIAAAKATDQYNPSRVNLARFAIPDFKLFEILHVDEPIGMDTLGVKHIFFNGEGIWLAGPLNDPNWFPEPVRALIRKTNAILREHREAFVSPNPLPTITNGENDVHVNCFPAAERTAWTFYNSGDVDQAGYTLRIPYKEGMRYYDAWNKRWITPQRIGNNTLLRIRVAARDLGCVIEVADAN